jgi:hypothetical protein
MPSYDPSDPTGLIVLLLLVDQSQTNFVTGPRSLGVVVFSVCSFLLRGRWESLDAVLRPVGLYRFYCPSAAR